MKLKKALKNPKARPRDVDKFLQQRKRFRAELIDEVSVNPNSSSIMQWLSKEPHAKVMEDSWCKYACIYEYGTPNTQKTTYVSICRRMHEQEINT